MKKIFLKKLIIEYLQYLEIEKNRALTTIKSYDFYLNRFMFWAKKYQIITPSEITARAITDYRLWLNRLKTKDLETISQKTQYYHLVALRSFLKFLSKRDIKSLAPEKIELGKLEPRQVSFLEGVDIEKLLSAPLAIEQKKILQLRDKAILETLFSTGLRVSELANLKKSDINLKRKEFPVKGKGRRVRIVFISNQTAYCLKEYFKARKDMSPYAFVSHDKARKKREASNQPQNITTRSIQRIIEKYKKIAGITKKVSPHTLRHSFATDLLINGADIRNVQELLGHKSITTTQIYTHITNKQLRETHQKYHGKNRGV